MRGTAWVLASASGQIEEPDLPELHPIAGRRNISVGNQAQPLRLVALPANGFRQAFSLLMCTEEQRQRSFCPRKDALRLISLCRVEVKML